MPTNSAISNTFPISGIVAIQADSTSGQTSVEVLVPILSRILTELRAIRLLLEAGSVPDSIDDVDDLIGLDEIETEPEES